MIYIKFSTVLQKKDVAKENESHLTLQTAIEMKNTNQWKTITQEITEYTKSIEEKIKEMAIKSFEMKY